LYPRTLKESKYRRGELGVDTINSRKDIQRYKSSFYKFSKWGVMAKGMNRVEIAIPILSE